MKQIASRAKKDRDQHRRLPIRQNQPQPFVRMTSVGAAQVAEKNGDPGRTRTSDLQLRRLLLYPTELRGLGPQCKTNIARPWREAASAPDPLMSNAGPGAPAAASGRSEGGTESPSSLPSILIDSVAERRARAVRRCG